MSRKQVNEIGILRHHDGTGHTRGGEDDGVVRVAKAEIPYRNRFHCAGLAEPRRKRRGQLRIRPDEHRARWLGGEDRMV